MHFPSQLPDPRAEYPVHLHKEVGKSGVLPSKEGQGPFPCRTYRNRGIVKEELRIPMDFEVSVKLIFGAGE